MERVFLGTYETTFAWPYLRIPVAFRRLLIENENLYITQYNSSDTVELRSETNWKNEITKINKLIGIDDFDIMQLFYENTYQTKLNKSGCIKLPVSVLENLSMYYKEKIIFIGLENHIRMIRIIKYNVLKKNNLIENFMKKYPDEF